MIEIPLSNSPEQFFNITINEENYDCRVILNSRLQQWSISISQNGEDIVNGISLVGGVDLMKQFNLPITNMYILNVDNPILDPTADNLGTVAKLLILTDEELSDVQTI